jgi:carbon monoxide dehydrogenase subunit G
MPVRFEVRTTIEAEQDRVFRAITDLENASEWMEGLISIERTTQGGYGVGTAWRETRKVMGKEATEHFEVVAHDPPRHLGLRMDGTRGSSGRGEYLFDYHLSPANGGTDVRLTGEIRGGGTIFQLMSRLFVGMYRKACLKDLNALKEHLEARSSAPSV